MEVRYCWLKAVAVNRGLDERAFALWPADGGLTAMAAPPAPTVAPATSHAADDVGVLSNCPKCPAPPNGFGEAFSGITPPPLPAVLASGAVVAQGWQVEGPSQPAQDGLPPELVFACRPVAGNRQDALDWLSSPEGEAWSCGARGVVLLSCFS